MSENKKELNEEELKTVSGGIGKDGDFYSFNDNDEIMTVDYRYTVHGTYTNVPYDTEISVTAVPMGWASFVDETKMKAGDLYYLWEKG